MQTGRAVARDDVEHRLRLRVAVELALAEPPHRQPHGATGERPARGRQVGLRRPGDDEPPDTGHVVDRSLHRAQHVRDQLPLVDEQWRGPDAQGCVGIGADEIGVGRPVEPQHVHDVTACRRRLPAGPRADDQDRRQAVEQPGQQPVDHPREILHRLDTSALAHH